MTLHLFTTEDIERITMPFEDWMKIHAGHHVREESWPGDEDWTVCICTECKCMYIADFNGF